jgi:plastocyanin
VGRKIRPEVVRGVSRRLPWSRLGRCGRGLSDTIPAGAQRSYYYYDFSMFTKALALFLFPALAAAQAYGGGPVAAPSSASASATSTAPAVAPTAPADTPGQMNVNVAFNETFTFNPANISAPVGTLVTFFYPNFGLNHSVTQSTFANPCTYLAANTTTNTSAGFDSGLQSSAQFTINITDTNPIWYFCKQVMHCEMGMVGSINAPATGNTFQAFQAAAIALNPNEVTTPDNGPVVGGVGASATGPPVPDLTSSSSSSTSSSSSSGALEVTTSIGFALFAAALAIAMAKA